MYQAFFLFCHYGVFVLSGCTVCDLKTVPIYRPDC